MGQGADRGQESMERGILIVDDDPMMLKLLGKYLRAVGYTVLSATNGREAMRILLNDGPSLLVSDWVMPEMDGIQLCKSIRSREGIGFVYIIMVTANSEKDRVVEAFEAGANDFLMKPFHRQELLARVNAGMHIVTLEADLMRKQREIQKTNAELMVLNGMLEQIATTDELTRLPNRREAMHRLEEYWSTAQRYDQPFACIIADIDHFKRCNDTYGHDVGDVILRETARTMEWSVRGGDKVCRVGGEEFLVLCPNTTAVLAAQAAERLRRAVASNTIACGDLALKVTVSLGVAERNRGATTPDELLKRADKALYEAKRTGRNMVRIAGRGPVSSPEAAAQACPSGTP